MILVKRRHFPFKNSFIALRKQWIMRLLVVLFVIINLYQVCLILTRVKSERTPEPNRTPRNDVIKLFDVPSSRFANFNNETGADDVIVPNIVHFIVFENSKIAFVHFICILAAMKNQNPEKIYFHTNVAQFTGEYWLRLMKIKKFADIVEIRKFEMPKAIFGQEIEESMRIFHGGDIARIRVLMEYGGIYLDNDSYIVRSLDKYRKFEMVIGYNQNHFLGTQILVAHKDARFLPMWLHTYDGAYYTDRWYYNAGELPATLVLSKKPELVHRVDVLLGTDDNFIYQLFQEYWSGWKDYYTFHLLARPRWQQVLKSFSAEARYPVDFNEYNVQKYPISFREMVNVVLTYEKEISE